MRSLALAAVGTLALAGCHGERAAGDHAHGDHAHGDHAGEHAHGDHPHGAAQGDDHGHGHGHEGASEVVTKWGRATQLFVEFPALVVGEESAFAAHLTRLQDHLAIDWGVVVVELAGDGGTVERFSVEGPAVPGIFRPVVKPARAGTRRVTLRLDSPVTSEVHDMGEFTVFATRAEADAAPAGEEEAGAISYLLEQQWKVPFRVEAVEGRPMRPAIPAFARLTLPTDAQATVVAPRQGRLVALGGRLPQVGEEVAAGAALFAVSTALPGAADPASLDLATDQAAIRVQAAQREVGRLTPLVEQGVVAKRRLDEARSELASAQAELRGARRRQSTLGQSQQVGGGEDALVVPSPIAGAVVDLFVAPGAWVAEGQPLARVVDRDRLWLDAGVPEAYVGRLGAVSGAWFRLDSVAGVLEVGRDALVSVGAEVDRETRTLPVRFRLDNLRRDLFAGMTTQAHVIVDAPRVAPAVPVEAVVDDGGVDVVFVQTGGESFARRPVRLGIRDGAYVEVLDGVALGEWVVARGAWSVKLAATSTATIGHGHAH
ncbi:MAG: efflux RND transporter periplasmic adaptor subunit [Myxococcales bacterium]|nr:efflux RND transporter periplasmic adaptor subunit [Myxococcales bacterium]